MWIDKNRLIKDLAIQENRLLKNVDDIRKSHKVHHKSLEKLENGSNFKRENSVKGENPERNLPGRCAFAITTDKIIDVIQLHTYDLPRGYKSINKMLIT